MKNTQKKRGEKGQTLVTLLVFTIVAMTVASAAVAIMINVAQATNRIEGSIDASQVAESGIENALLRLLRDPSYTGETLPVGDGSVVIEVTGTDPKIVTAIGTVNSYSKTVQATVTFTNNIMQVTSWEEVY
jgi:flagellar basal body-associated protein FliL